MNIELINAGVTPALQVGVRMDVKFSDVTDADFNSLRQWFKQPGNGGSGVIPQSSRCSTRLYPRRNSPLPPPCRFLGTVLTPSTRSAESGTPMFSETRIGASSVGTICCPTKFS